MIVRISKKDENAKIDPYKLGRINAYMLKYIMLVQSEMNTYQVVLDEYGDIVIGRTIDIDEKDGWYLDGKTNTKIDNLDMLTDHIEKQLGYI